MLQSIYYMVTEQEEMAKQNIQMNNQISSMARKVDISKAENDKDYLLELLVDASHLGEEAGFITGFKYAVKLMASSFD